MNFFFRLLGICRTPIPSDAECWSFADNRVTIDLARAKELGQNGGALRLEGKGLPQRVLIFRGDDGKLYACKNKCTHMGGRRVDPLPGTHSIECCSVSKSTYDYSGNVMKGPAPDPLTLYPVDTTEEKAVIRMESQN